MNRRHFVTRFACAVALALGTSSALAQTVLKFSHTDQPGAARQAAALIFARSVENYSQGRVKVQVFPAGQLANDPKAVEQLQLGGIDFTVTGTGTYATHIPTLNLMLMPYLVDTYDQGWKFYDDSAWLKKQFEQGPSKGFRILATWEAGFRSMTTKGPLASPEDAKGKKLRTYPNEMQRWLLEAMGFTIQILPVTEVYLAIQQNVVWGQENPIDTIYANKFYEVAPNVTLTQHVYSPIPLAISEKTWQKLSPADRDAVTKAARETAAWIRKEIRANDDRQLADMTAKGAKVARPASSRSASRCSRRTPRRRRSTAPTSTQSSPRRRRSARRSPRNSAPRAERSARAGGERRAARRPLLPSGPPSPLPIRVLGAAVDWAVVALGAAMVALVFVNVVFHVFGGDVAWTTELCEFMMVWVTFLGGAAATRRGAHMRITEFLDKLDGLPRRWADALVQALRSSCWGCWSGSVSASWRRAAATSSPCSTGRCRGSTSRSRSARR